jgi:pheromone shutdown-related protein TraB
MPTEILELKGRRVILVGTAHVSLESVKNVEDAIREHSPDAVAVELCQQRYHALKNENKWEQMELDKVIRGGQIYMFLLQILLTNFQRKIGDDLGVKPGAEMIAAVEMAEGEGIPVVLADRDIRVTLKRAMDSMSFREKFRILLGFLEGVVDGQDIDQELVERLKEKDVLTELMEELAVQTPSIKRVLVDERDQHIADRIFQAGGERVLAVVGAGHMEGIIRRLKALDGAEYVVSYGVQMQGEDIMPSGSGRKLKPLSLALPAVILALVIWLFMRDGGQMTLGLVLRLFLLQGTGAALGVLVVGGHPLSALTAFFAAPLTFINPTIAVGWVAGYVELRFRKPRVVDFKNLVKLKGLGDYLGNRVVRLILVVALANLGSMFGSSVGALMLGLAGMGVSF